MPKDERVVASTSVILELFIQNSGSTTGAGLTGLVFNSASMTAYYKRDTGSASTAITLANITTIGTWVNNGFREVDSTNMPGIYEFNPPNAAFTSGASTVTFMLKGATNMAPCVLEIALKAVNTQDAVRMGMTALPNAAAEAAGGLYTRGTGAGQINQPANGQIDANAVKVDGVALTSHASGKFPADVLTIAGTTQTARDIGASVLLSAGTGTGQLDFTTGVVKANATQLLGGTIPTPTVTGVPNVNVKTWNDLTTVALPLVPTTAGRTLDVSATGEAGIDWANVGSPTTTVGLTGTTIATSQVVASVSGAVASVTGAVGSVTARVTANVDQVDGAALDTHDAGSFPADVRTWVGSAPNALVSGRVDASVGAVAASQDVALRRGTAQTGAAGSITLDSGASATDSLYQWGHIGILSGTGAGQSRLITGYTGSTKVATVAPNWTTNPDSTSVFAIVPNGRAIVGYVLETVVTAAAAGVLDVNAKNLGGTAQTGRDIGANVLLSSGTGTGQLDFTSGVVKANTTQVDGVALTAHASGKVPVDVLTIAGTTQTARDIGASVLLSPGTGTGQLDFTSGVVKGNVTQIVGGTVPTPNVTGVPKVDPVVTSIIATVNDASATTTSFIGASSLSSSNDFYTGSVLAFRSGTLQGIARRITSYVGATRTLVFTVAFPTAPANTDSFEILGKID